MDHGDCHRLRWSTGGPALRVEASQGSQHPPRPGHQQVPRGVDEFCACHWPVSSWSFQARLRNDPSPSGTRARRTRCRTQSGTLRRPRSSGSVRGALRLTRDDPAGEDPVAVVAVLEIVGFGALREVALCPAATEPRTVLVHRLLCFFRRAVAVSAQSGILASPIRLG